LLSEDGQKQAKLNAEAITGIKVDSPKSNSLSRAVQTTGKIEKAASLEIESVEGLREMKYGEIVCDENGNMGLIEASRNSHLPGGAAL